MKFSWNEDKDKKNYEERIDDEIHLISARIATPRERRIYNGYSNDDIEPWRPA